MPTICSSVLRFFTCSSPEVQKASLSREEEEEVWSSLWPIPGYCCTSYRGCRETLEGLLCYCCPGRQWSLSGVFPRNHRNTQGSTCYTLRVTQTVKHIHLHSGFPPLFSTNSWMSPSSPCGATYLLPIEWNWAIFSLWSCCTMFWFVNIFPFKWEERAFQPECGSLKQLFFCSRCDGQDKSSLWT